MDANQTRFQLVFGQADWFGDAASGSPPADAQIAWRASDATVGLPQQLFVFPVAPGTPLLSAADRRGAGQDRYGNYYWIGPAQDEILFLAPGLQQQAQHFWSASDPAGPSNTGSTGMFSPVSASQAASYTMGGLTVTTHHYLLVGLIQQAGLLLFDLYMGGPPLEYLWPAGTPFAPFDLAAAPDGGAWILDRVNRRYWGLDPYFRVLGAVEPSGTPPRVEDFQPVADETDFGTPCDFEEPVAADQAMPVAAADPIGIAALPDGSVLILDSQTALGYSLIYRYRLRKMLGPPVALNQIDIGQPALYQLLGQDLAFVVSAQQQAGAGLQGTLYVADTLGAQTFAFAYSTANSGWASEPLPQFLPMLRFGGKALVTGPGGVSYDYDQRWAPLVAQPRARFNVSGVWQLPQRDATQGSNPALCAFDGKEPGCVWHRLMMDGTIPPGAQLQVQSRAADSMALLSNAAWNTEPLPYLRATGAELPYYQPALNCSSSRTGTWELLFQAAKGRYLQLLLTFSGGGNSTPRIQAVRAYYPRFSYLTKYLPTVYQDNTTSASFLERFLANPEGFFTAIEGRITQAQELFDARTVPAEYLAWLAGWVGICFDFTWGEPLQRFFLENAPRFFQTRGTLNGMVRMIRMSLDQCADESLFDPADVEHFSVRIIEHYLLRSDPGVVLGDPTDVQAPGAITAGAAWTPSQGVAPLDQLFRSFLSAEYGSISALNLAWNTSFAGFDDPTLRFPAIQPSSTAEAADWSQFISTDIGFTYALVTNADEPAYENFLMQRYQQPSDINTAYGLTGSSALTAFSDIQAMLWNGLASGLPSSGVFLQDWILFVSVVLPTQQNAHLFSVVVPVSLNASVASQMQRQSVAQRIAQQEKPAHTNFDVKLYWAAFCAGSARVGIETVIGPSSRFAALQLDQSTLGASYLGFVAPWSVRGRMVVARDQVQQPTGIRCRE
ncbi:MAG TPA: phage tail protein [Bryobacteraceae bacterium]|nr:phage tail protein [Bryobacteraceae bacterium]